MAGIAKGWILRINDGQPHRPDVLIGLEHLVRCVLQARPESEHLKWEAEKGVWGYGEFVCSLEDTLRHEEWIPVDLARLLGALDGGEYFYHARLRAKEAGLEVSVFDSSFLELVASRELVYKCRKQFANVEVIPPAN